jgi:hypothetical protein
MKSSVLAVLLATLVACMSSKPPSPSPPASAAVASGSAAAPSAPSASATVVPSPVPAEPPYDLSADLEARTNLIREQIGAKTKFEVVEGVFLVAAPSGTLGSSAAVTKMALQAYFNKRFSDRPKKVVAVLLFDGAPPYQAYCKTHWKKDCGTPYGFYDRESRTVVMNVAPGIGTLTHELVHPIVEADFPRAPDWINEGIASLYEAFNFPKPGEIRGNKNFRFPALFEALRSKTDKAHASLPSLFAMADDEFRGSRESLNYAIARYFCQWMDSQNKLWPFYRAWRDDFANDPTGEKAFVAVMGKTPAALDPTWVAWVKAL